MPLSNAAAWATAHGVFEAITWAFDPLGWHEKEPPQKRAIQAAAYAGPPLLFAYFGAPPRGLGLFFPFILYTFVDITLNQWVPYLCGVRGRNWALNEARLERRGVPRALPPLCGRPPPPLEQTLLLPLVAGSLAACFAALIALAPSERAAALGGLQWSGALYLFVLGVRVKDEAGRALGGGGAAGGAGDGAETAGALDGLSFDYTAVLRVALVLSALLWAWLALA